MKRIFRPIVFIVAVVYFAVDAVFSYVAKPLADWLGRLRLFSGIRTWVVSGNRYSALALFAVPVAVLEPVKPIAAYLMATGHLAFGFGSLVGAEILKLTVVERLFELNRNKLLSIRAFAWGYGYWRLVMTGSDPRKLGRLCFCSRHEPPISFAVSSASGKRLRKRGESHGNHVRDLMKVPCPQDGTNPQDSLSLHHDRLGPSSFALAHRGPIDLRNLPLRAALQALIGGGPNEKPLRPCHSGSGCYPAFAAETMSSLPSDSWTITNYYKQDVYDKGQNTVGKIDDVLWTSPVKLPH